MLKSSLEPQSIAVPARPLKICLLGYRSNPYSGGQGIYIKYLSQALADAGHQVDVISGEPYPQLDPRVTLIKLPGLNLYEHPNHALALRWHHLKSFTDTFEYFSMLTGGFPEPYTFGRRLVKYFEREQPRYDIVHDNQSLCYGVLKLQQTGHPVVTTIHHPIASDLAIALSQADSWKLRLLIRRWHSFLRMQNKVVPRLKHLVTVSGASRADVAKAFGIPDDRLKIVHNGIDTQTFKPRPDVTESPLRIMATASSDTPLKGLVYLLEAVALLREEMPEIELVVIGKLKDDGATIKRIKKLDLDGTVRFVSNVETEEIVQLYAEASVVAVPSVYEGFGLPAAEAMACGKAVVSTTGGALPEVVGDCGVLVPTRDAIALRDAIKTLLLDDSRRKQLGRKARARIEASFSWQVAATQMESIYRQVTEQGNVDANH